MCHWADISISLQRQINEYREQLYQEIVKRKKELRRHQKELLTRHQMMEQQAMQQAAMHQQAMQQQHQHAMQR